MNWYKKANLWDEIKKHGPSSKPLNDEQLNWLIKNEKVNLDRLYEHPAMKDFYKRKHFTNQYGWSVPSEDAIEKIKSFVGNDTILEVGSGHGLWAKLMKDMGINIIATDFLSTTAKHGYLGRPRDQFFTDVEDLKGTEAVNKYGNANVLMMSWPPYDDPFAYEVLKIFKGNKLIFIGEGEGGCTADEKFFGLLRAEWTEVESYINIPRWSGIHDYLFLYKRQ